MGRFRALAPLALAVLLAGCGAASTAGAAQPTATGAPAVPTVPTVTAAPTATSAPLTRIPITFGDVELHNGILGIVAVNTQPGAKLQISVIYCGTNGPQDNDPALQGQVAADAKGGYLWNWVPNVTCTDAGKSTASAYVDVTALTATGAGDVSETVPVQSS